MTAQDFAQAISARRLLTGSEPATVRSHRANVVRAGIRLDKAAAALRLLADVSQPQCALIERLLFGPGEES